MADFRIEGTAGLEKLAVAYREGDRKIRSAMAKGLREPASPLGKQVTEKGSADMPHGGGLSERLASAKTGISLSLLGRSVSVSLRVSDSKGDAIKKIDQTGEVRHPVWHTGTWSSTSVPKGTYTKAFFEGAPEVQAALYVQIQAALAEIAAAATEA